MNLSRRNLLKLAAAILAVSACDKPNNSRHSFNNPNKETSMQSKFIKHQGAMLHYQTGGTETAPVIVLLHGGFGSIADFAPLLPRLQQHYRVIAIDTRGHGRSSLGTVALTYAQAAEDARQILRHEGVEKYSLFGFSDGGTTAYRLGAADKNIQKILTVGAEWHKKHLDGMRPMFETINLDFVKENLPEQLAAYQAANPEPDAEKWVAALKAMWLDEGASGYPNENIRQIQAPVLAIRGEADFLFAFDDWAALKTELPEVHLMNVPFAAHEAIKEQPEIVWAAVQAFGRK